MSKHVGRHEIIISNNHPFGETPLSTLVAAAAVAASARARGYEYPRSGVARDAIVSQLAPAVGEQVLGQLSGPTPDHVEGWPEVVVDTGVEAINILGHAGQGTRLPEGFGKLSQQFYNQLPPAV